VDTPSKVQVRPARAEDFPQVREIAAHIWEGHDYVPEVWDKWLADPEGEFAVVTVDGRVAGLAKLTQLSEREWWMQGLRVDPAYRRQGLGRELHRHLVQRFGELGGGVARFSTASENVAVHKLALELGFEKRAAYALYEAKPQPRGANEFHRLGPVDAERVWAFLRRSRYFEEALRSFEEHWVWFFLTKARLLERLQAGRIYGWFGDRRSATEGALDGVIITDKPDQDREGNPRLSLSYLDATEGSLAVMAQAFRTVVGQMGLPTVRLKALARPERLVALEQAGYRRQWDAEIWLFALEGNGEGGRDGSR
jgi:ribosomal protein S18 acetylase RimI-like enzyme